jgi:hypothetical protein
VEVIRWLRNAFGPGEECRYVSPEEVPEERREEIIRVLAKEIVARRLTAPAIFFLETVKPLSFVGSQAMVFLQPIIQAVFPFRSYNELSVMLEERENIEALLCEMERLEALEREERRRRRLEKKHK